MKPIPRKTLGSISAEFIYKLKKHSKTLFTLSEAVEVYSKSRLQTIKFISDLVKRGILAKIKPGMYLILETGEESLQLTNWPLLASVLAESKQYFISHYSAMRLHGMTNHPLLDVYITLPRHAKSRTISSLTYHFIYSKPEHFWGGVDLWISKQIKVNVSELERTISDGFDRPDLCGGIKEIVQGIWFKQKDINWEKLIGHAKNIEQKQPSKD